MKLSEKQALFTFLTSKLIGWAYDHGYQLTFGETWRTPEQAALNESKGAGIRNSLHTQRLAVDFNLFKDGRYLQNSEDHKPLGDYWKTLDPSCRWGGDFEDNLGRSRPDGNHYSLEHEGRK